MPSFPKILYLVGFMLMGRCTFAQSNDSLNPLPRDLLSHVELKINGLSSKMEKENNRILRRWFQKEEKLLRKLARNDSAKAAELALDSRRKYNQLLQKLDEPSGKLPYVPYLDTLKTTLKFLHDPEVRERVGLSVTSSDKHFAIISNLEGELKNADQIKSFIKQRQLMWKDKLIGGRLLKSFKKMNKDFYYYSAEVQALRKRLRDPDWLEMKAFNALKKLPAFNKFMSDHSELASMFRLSGQSTTLASSSSPELAGLQTRTAIQQRLQQQFGSDGVQQLSSNISAAQEQLSAAQSQVVQLGANSSDIETPDFKPNSQRTKSFKERLEFGTNLQSQPSSRFLPTSSELGVSMGYKLNDYSTVGLGISYRWGWGKPFNDIKITHEGTGLRSFIDWKLKGSLFITGGYELNYQSSFQRIDILKDLTKWQSAGLIGLTKRYEIGRVSGNMQLLWDILSYRQVPKSNAVKFRFGYVL